MARGRFEHTMDGKGRVSMPASFRGELQPREDQPPVVTSLLDCAAVGVYSHEQWNAIEHRLASFSQVQPEVQALNRVLSGAVPCPIDGQGRILVPPHLRREAGLEREVIIAGVGRRIEIWDREAFDAELARIREQGPEMARIVADLGL